MVLERDQHKYQLCGGKHKDEKLEVHHIIFRKNGGSDEHTNLVTLCHTCHHALHHGQISRKKLETMEGSTKEQLKHARQMNTIISQLKCSYPNATVTYDHITKENCFAQSLK
ncbi:MAG: HNH endonuclease [Desulfovibrionaceae bacterium]|nr:HNH endonuclease [Desulfovibrionaceae bacterium]